MSSSAHRYTHAASKKDCAKERVKPPQCCASAGGTEKVLAENVALVAKRTVHCRNRRTRYAHGITHGPRTHSYTPHRLGATPRAIEWRHVCTVRTRWVPYSNSNLFNLNKRCPSVCTDRWGSRYCRECPHCTNDLFGSESQSQSRLKCCLVRAGGNYPRNAATQRSEERENNVSS